MTNYLGVNGFEHRKHDIYKPTSMEAKAAGAVGGQRSGQRRHSTVKWRAVNAALAVGKGGAPSWSALADLYDHAYRTGYAASYNARKRAERSVP